MFSHGTFGRASQDAFFVCVRSDDARFHAQKTVQLLRELGATAVEEVRG
jgi:hypothetical protein